MTFTDVKREFRNEYGEHVEIRLSREPDDSIRVCIEGAKASGEWVITVKELVELGRAVALYLASAKEPLDDNF